MAVAALSTSALPQPGWDETIVPSLRRRLEDESRMLSKRLSTISIPSSADGPVSSDKDYHTPAPPPSARPVRPRTKSQPFPFEGPSSRVVSPSSVTSQSHLPRSRIPTASRNPSTSHLPPGPGAAVHKSHPSQKADLPPAQPPSARLSTEEERAFEHWYRGDTARNGGVGEYRVGRRHEMLDIANYGHEARPMRGRPIAQEEPSPNADAPFMPMYKKRAESLSSREGRESIYMADEIDEHRMVQDETPLTDMEADETDAERSLYTSSQQQSFEFGVQDQNVDPGRQKQHQHQWSVSPPPPIPVAAATIPASKRQRSASMASSSNGTSATAISNPKATRSPKSSAQSNGVPAPQVNTSQNSKSVSPPKGKPSPSKAPQQSQQKKTSSPAVNNRGRTPAEKVKAKATRRRSKSVPLPSDVLAPGDANEDYGLIHAIPETSAPKVGDGNWDEVILPTVARRMGIPYEKEEYQPPAREEPVPPAPGTFGFDYEKYKPPQAYNEFGSRPAPVVAEQPPSTPPPEPAPHPEPQSRPSRFTNNRPDSLLPFSSYRNTAERQGVPQILVTAPTMDGARGKGEKYVGEEEEEGGAGCCRCVVM